MAGIPGMSSMPLAGRVCKSITDASPASGDANQIDFKQMVRTMAIFREKDKQELSQIKFLFRMCASKGDGQISRGELTEVLQEISAKQLSALTEA